VGLLLIAFSLLEDLRKRFYEQSPQSHSLIIENNTGENAEGIKLEELNGGFNILGNEIKL
jgi:hypothetical protein